MMYKWEVPAMTAVIYARYSSDNQREESIEGQIRECTAYAEKNGITIVKHYIDRAISAKTDNRPEFQQMIKDRPQTVAGRSGGQPDHAACQGRCRHGIHHRQGDGTAKQGEYQHSPL